MSELPSSDNNPGNVAMSLLRAVGGSSRPSGRGWFIFRNISVASSSAAVVGLTMAAVMGYTMGLGAAGFLFGSCMGYCCGSLSHFAMARAEAFKALQRYPRLMQHHLEVNFPAFGFEKLEAERRQRDGTLMKWFHGEGDWPRGYPPWCFGIRGIQTRVKAFGRQGQLISSHQTALESLLQIEARREVTIIDDIVTMERGLEDEKL